MGAIPVPRRLRLRAALRTAIYGLQPVAQERIEEGTDEPRKSDGAPTAAGKFEEQLSGGA